MIRTPAAVPAGRISSPSPLGECHSGAVLIRREAGHDIGAIDAVHRRALATDDGTEPAEVGLVQALRLDEAWVPALSLVAELGRNVVGHVVATEGELGESVGLGLGPIGVLPECQGVGIGSGLLHAVLAAADALDYPLVALVGHLDYYPRFGFVPASSLGIEAPDPSWGAHFQVRTLTAYRPRMRGHFRFAAPFDGL